VESNPHRSIKLPLAVIVASAVVIMGVLAVASGQEPTETSMIPGEITMGQTATEAPATTTTDPTTIETSKASPTMKADRPPGFR
jgi:hypothetical protein